MIIYMEQTIILLQSVNAAKAKNLLNKGEIKSIKDLRYLKIKKN